MLARRIIFLCIPVAVLLSALAIVIQVDADASDTVKQAEILAAAESLQALALQDSSGAIDEETQLLEAQEDQLADHLIDLRDEESAVELVVDAARGEADASGAELAAAQAVLESVLAELEVKEDELQSTQIFLFLQESERVQAISCLGGVQAAMNAQSVGDEFTTSVRLNAVAADCDAIAALLEETT